MRLNRPAFSGPAQAAFTLTEVVVGMAVVALVMLSLYTGVASLLNSLRQARENLRATQILLEKLEALRLYTWEQLVADIDPDELEDSMDPFDPDDPHVPEDDVAPFVMPTTFTAPFVPGATNSEDLVYRGTFTVSDAPVTEEYSDNLRLITVSVEWRSQGRDHSRSMQTLFAKYGMQNNVAR